MKKFITLTLLLLLSISLMGCNSFVTGTNQEETIGEKTAQEKIEYIKNDEYFGYQNEWGWDLSKIEEVLGTDFGSAKSFVKNLDIKIFNVSGEKVKVVFFEKYAQSIEILD